MYVYGDLTAKPQPSTLKTTQVYKHYNKRGKVKSCSVINEWQLHLAVLYVVALVQHKLVYGDTKS